jgi:uncharacterized protein TP_0783
MFFKGKNKFVFLLAVIFALFYIFVTPTPMGYDLYFMPKWAVSVIPAPSVLSGFENNTQPDGALKTISLNGKTPVNFMLGNYFGYFSEDGQILKSEQMNRRVSLSPYAWTAYPEKALSSQIYSPEGEALAEIKEPGFTYIDEDRFFLFEPGGSGVCKYSADGQKEWRHIHTAPITAFHSSAGGTVVGYSDGMLACIDTSGNNIFNFYPGGSKYQVIMGAAISDDGKRIICVCGLEQQRVILISVIDKHYKIIHHTFLKKDMRRQLFTDFAEKNRFALFESADGLGIVDGKELKTSFMEEYGTVINAGMETKTGILTVLVKNGGEHSLITADFPNFITGKTAFNSEDSFLVQLKNRVYLGVNNKILAFDIRGLK